MDGNNPVVQGPGPRECELLDESGTGPLAYGAQHRREFPTKPPVMLKSLVTSVHGYQSPNDGCTLSSAATTSSTNI